MTAIYPLKDGRRQWWKNVLETGVITRQEWDNLLGGYKGVHFGVHYVYTNQTDDGHHKMVQVTIIEGEATLSQELTFISDRGHGWLRVPIGELETLGILGEINKNRASYHTADFAYLEEDIDLAIYLDARREQGFGEPEINNTHVTIFEGRDHYQRFPLTKE